MLFVLHPAVSVLAEDQRASLRAAMLKRWKFVVHGAVLLFIISGFYNYLVVMAPQHKKDGLYHALMGIKIMLGFGIFFIAELMVGRTKLADKIRQQLPKFLSINLSMALAIVLISGFLKTRGPVTKSPEPAPAIANDTGMPSKAASESSAVKTSDKPPVEAAKAADGRIKPQPK
jgi:hypothetical protein